MKAFCARPEHPNRLSRRRKGGKAGEGGGPSLLGVAVARWLAGRVREGLRKGE